jgi:hypothetical protein
LRPRPVRQRLARQPRSPVSGVLFPGGWNPRHSRGLGWRAPVSDRQFLVFRSLRGGFRAPVSARHFPISIPACRRLVRLLTEAGSRRALRVRRGSCPRDAPSETGHNHCRRHEVDRLAVRGFLTAVVRKKLGLMLVSEKIGEERVYCSRTMSHRNANAGRVTGRRDRHAGRRYLASPSLRGPRLLPSRRAAAPSS